MKPAKLCCMITDIMFVIAAIGIGISLTGIIQFINVTVMLQDVANNTAVTTVSTILLMVYAFAFALAILCILLQLICVIHSFCVSDNLRLNGILKIFAAVIDVIFMASFVIETQKFYGYMCLVFCIVLLGMSITQTVVSK